MYKMSSSQNIFKIDLCIGDQLTSVSCGHIIVELVKFIVYQRLQIPYTYQWLKHLINNKKSCHNEEINECFQSQKHFRIASLALENLDFIFKSLRQEIDGPSLPVEVCFTFGATPMTCKEIYRFILPPICHKPQCQSTCIACDQKIQQSVFKTLVTSELLNKVFLEPLAPTNMYVFLQKKITTNHDILVNSDNFSQATGCRIPKNAKKIVIDFRKQDKKNIACCNDFQIYQDTICDTMTELLGDDWNRFEQDGCEVYEIKSTDNMEWFQSTYVLRGFKDCIVNGNSVTNKWLK